MNILHNEFINEITEKIEKLGLLHVDTLLKIDIDHHVQKIIATEGPNQILIFIERVTEMARSRQGPYNKVISFTENDLTGLHALALEAATPIKFDDIIVDTYYGPAFITALIEDIMKHRTETTKVIVKATDGSERTVKLDTPVLLEEDLKMLQELKRDLVKNTYPCNLINLCAYFGVLRFLKTGNKGLPTIKNLMKDSVLWQRIAKNTMQLLEPYVGPMTIADVIQLFHKHL
jgi:hypothetical protein